MPISPIEDLADEHLAAMARLDPCEAARSSIGGSEELLTDYSVAGVSTREDRLRDTLRRLGELAAGGGESSASDRVTATFLAERVGARLAQHEAGDVLGVLGPINGPVSAIRFSFDNLPTSTESDLDVLAARLAAVPTALASVSAGVEAAIDIGRPPARRQVLATIEQCLAWGGTAGSAGCFELHGSRRSDLGPIALAAGAAMRDLASRLASDAVGRARDSDAAGPEVYARAATMMLGAPLDAAEASDWAWEEMRRLEADARRTIDRILPGSTLVQAKAHLDRTTAIEGAEPWRQWLQDLTDRTTESLNGSTFVIDPSILQCQAMLPPEGGAAAPYYSAPSEDLRIPGRTWYPTVGRTHFPTWEMTTTVFHEAVPGHHLQIGRVKVLTESLSRFRRNTNVSGHIEGWALYAERLMDELGAYEDDPGGRLGFLAFQMLRAARVIVDLGLHLGIPVPEGEPGGGGPWTAALARQFIVERCGLSEPFAASEVDRYLGWPAQAICYKLGERAWLDARAEARSAAGDEFDLKGWHSRALDLGSLGLAQLRDELSAALPA